MALKNFVFSSESVSEGHPDKVADQISDSILDAMLAQDPTSRVACETMITTGVAVVAGEITSKAVVDIQAIVRQTVLNIGYDDGAKGFDGNSCAVMVALDKQSPDISQGVTAGAGLHNKEDMEQGAGDQGLMFGYACDETPELMPAPIMWSHHLVKKCSEVRKSGKLTFLRPDSKSQVSVVYENGKPTWCRNIVISTQHNPEVEYKVLRDAVIEEVISPVIPKSAIRPETKIWVNPTGRFVLGGPHGDCGLTGRKIIVDTYGGMGRHGGGAFSGKDPSKVDRSAAYMARYVAKNLVAAGLCSRCEVQLAYAIGVAEPQSVLVDDFGTGKVSQDRLAELVKNHFNLKPGGIVKTLDLLKPRYLPTAAYGHFGRTEDSFTWERTDKAEALKADAGV